MDRETLFKFCVERYGTEPDYPFRDADDIAVLRHGNTRKWYAVVMPVALSVFGIGDGRRADVMNVKVDPLAMGSLLSKKGIYPAYHMNKTTWVSVVLSDVEDVDTVLFLLDMSFSATDRKKQ